MNNEIKEILDKLKDSNWYDELDLTGDKWIELKQTETNQILDYITKLQEDVRTGQEINSELQQENEKLKRLADKDYTELNIVELKAFDYKSRCEKAINKLRRDYYTNYTQHNDDVVREALNILQNGSEDE